MNINNSIIPNLYLIENSSLFNNSRLMALRSNQIGSISDDFCCVMKTINIDFDFGSHRKFAVQIDLVD